MPSLRVKKRSTAKGMMGFEAVFSGCVQFLEGN